MRRTLVSGLGSAALLAIAGVIALVTFLPWGAWLGAAQPEEMSAYVRSVRSWGLWLAIVGPVAVLVGLRWREGVALRLDAWIAWVGRLPARRFAWIAALLFGLAGVVLSRILFSHNPHLVDAIAQLFQARIFASGALTAPAPEHFEFFGASHLVRHAGRWFSQYPPGHPALLAVGVVVGLPWLVNPIFAAATLLLLFGTAGRLLGEGSAKLAVILYFASPLILFMSASFMNHVTVGFFLALALYAAVRAAEAERGWSIVTGIALGLAATIRPLESAAWALVLGCWLLWRRGWGTAITAAATCVIAAAPLLLYNALTTGHPLRFGYTLLWGAGHGLGFHTDPWGQAFTPAKSFANTAIDFQRLNVQLFRWPFPCLIPLLLGLVLVKDRVRERGAALLLASLLLAAPVAYFFYWHRDNFLGPRFLHASLLPALLLSVLGIVLIDRRVGRWSPVFRLVLLAGIVYALALKVPENGGVIAGSYPEMKLHPERAGLDRALVFVKVSWGSRLVGRMWGWEVPASEAEQSYHAVDGCRMQKALDEADSSSAAGADSSEVRSRLRGQLARWREQRLPVDDNLLPDPTVLVDTRVPLEERCALEVQRDSAGFTVYGTLVWRNDPWLREGVIYARDLGPELNRRLMKEYTGHAHYLYTPLTRERGAKPVLLRYAAAEYAVLRREGAKDVSREAAPRVPRQASGSRGGE